MRYISADEMNKLVDYKVLIDQMKVALSALSRGKVIVPQRIHLDSGRFKSTYLFMPVLSEELKKVAFKYVGVCSENIQRGIPAINGFVMLADAVTGIPEMFFDGATLTAIRTGAVGGTAIDLLSREDSKVMAVFGTGPQAETQIYAALSVREIEKIYVYYRRKEKGELFVKKIVNEVDVDVELTNDKSMIEKADIIIAATNSKIPLFDSSNLKFRDGVHINAIGSFKPDMQEIDEYVYEKFDVFVDSKIGCSKESGDIIKAIKKGVIKETEVREIGELIAKGFEFNFYKAKNTIFKSVGNAAFDLYSSFYFYNLIVTK
ncbi:hypothetical protein FHQ18_02045 [Deferribacter autotrophicus]|uniref:Ornithine cyclodeaminase family protein n=1 Tax=Deferribacter autotrophicus TaxID=500465 RepID=A0A5A8F8U2_9BACT|nr:hypothetical protein [Deferribacter autotrophicus]KAA0259256.1 hypothetical protein FHQ18_02045 [Deferribacter autotrophicus]